MYKYSEQTWFSPLTCDVCHVVHTISHIYGAIVPSYSHCQSPPTSEIFLPVSVSVSVSYIGWREGDIFITVKLG